MRCGRLFSAALLSVIVLTGCSSTRPPVPPGTVPERPVASAEDERYGHEVLSELTDQFPLDRDDARINRVRSVVDKLTAAAPGSMNSVWHVYVLVDSNFKNAAATRGNYIFVWTAMLDTVRDDTELATVLAHEIGHVLAGHTAPDPADEANRIMTGVAGEITRGVLIQGGVPSIAGDLAGLAVQTVLEALIVNPDAQDRELEADHIGLFLMSDAGYDPEAALEFWKRVQGDPSFGSSGFEFLSTHPSSAQRYAALSAVLPQARERYARATGLPLRQPVPPPRPDGAAPARRAQGGETWVVEEPSTAIYGAPRSGADLVRTIERGTRVTVDGRSGRYLAVSSPERGYVLGRHLSPVD